MTRHVLLGSGGYRTEERARRLVAAMQAHFGPIRKLLFLPYALADHDAYVAKLNERGLNAGYELDGIHRHADPVQAVEQAEGIYVGGGNTFRLLNEMYERKLLEPIRRRVDAGVPYLGVSAGTNVACPTMQTTNDMPIVMPPSFAALNLVPFQVNAHYFNGQTFVKHQGAAEGELEPHFGETRDERLAEFHEMNATPVIGLWEAGHLKLTVENGICTGELGGTSARVFLRGKPPQDIAAGTRFRCQDGEIVIESSSA